MSDFDLSIRGRVVLPSQILTDGYIAISGGRIVSIGEGTPPSAKEAVDFRGHWIIPGVVDGQVHTGSQANQEGFIRGTKAAAAGGVTTIVDMPYDDPEPVTNVELLRRKIRAVETEAHVDVALYGTVKPEGGLDSIGELVEGGVCAFKFSTYEANPTRFPRIPDDVLTAAFRRVKPFGLACGVHNQDQELTDKNIKSAIAAGDTGWDAFGRAHTPLVEELATAKIYEIGAITGARAHVVHCSLPRGFEVCKMYRNAGYAATIETCVQYLMLNEEDHMPRFGAKTKIYPPIRPKRCVDALWPHIADGTCDFVSSDHVSWSLDRKSHENIFANSSGSPGLETLLPAFWTGCEEHGLPPTTAVRQLCEGPGKHFMLSRKGSIFEGADADIVVLEPGRFVFDPSNSLAAVSWSAFEGREFRVRVAATFVRGTLAWDGTRITNNPGHGRFVRPGLES